MIDAIFLLLACLLRIVVVRSRLPWQVALASFVTLVVFGLPFIYYFSSSWHEELVASPLTIYVGEPVIVFGVPLVSLLFDLALRPWERSLLLLPQWRLSSDR